MRDGPGGAPRRQITGVAAALMHKAHLSRLRNLANQVAITSYQPGSRTGRRPCARCSASRQFSGTERTSVPLMFGLVNALRALTCTALAVGIVGLCALVLLSLLVLILLILILLALLGALFARLPAFALGSFFLPVSWCGLVRKALLVLSRVRRVVVSAITHMSVHSRTRRRSVLIWRLSRTLALRHRTCSYRYNTRCYRSGHFSFYT